MSLEELALRQLSDYDANDPGTIFQDLELRLRLEDAYQLQFLVARLRERRGEALAGYKIGCVSPVVQRQLGIAHPVFGHVWATELHPHGAALDPRRYTRLAIEGELAVRLGNDGRAVEAPFPVIELHNRLFRRAATAAELVANNAIHAGLVLPRQRAAAAGQIEEISVFINGTLVGQARACAFAGGPAEAVERVRSHLEPRGLTLAPGQIVLTGTPLPLYPVQEGDQVEVRASNGAWSRMQCSRRL
jgi:2-keto-4-pentenoate hydratase